MAALIRFGCCIGCPHTCGQWDPIIAGYRQQRSPFLRLHLTLALARAGVGEWAAIAGSVTDGSDAAPVERWRAACYRQDAAAADVGVHGPDWRVEPQPQQVTTRVLRRVAVVESSACMQDRVVIDEIRFARLKREFQHEFRP